MFQVVYRTEAIKALKKIPKNWQRRILKAIEPLKQNPFLGKTLKGEFEGFFSLRVWPYRIIYRIERKKLIIVLVDIGHRQGIYN